ncbi:hypothetical protein SLS55_009165 [Diplodia seriata]|uniref:Tail specific protease domain-containing protein n=1 Tax=Diplodia seriata TaxID=420778 RepID=A0ABR3C823_9PEZI
MLKSAVLLAASLAANLASGDDGCARLHHHFVQQDPAVAHLVLPASLAYSCLKAIPVNVEGDSQLLSEIPNILTWQSTLAYLKDPPKGYPNPPVDVLAGLDDIKKNVSNNGFESEYDVQNAITTLLHKAYDGHLDYLADISSAIGFAKNASQADLVSLSLDGKSLPKVYLKTDIDAVHYGANFTPSPIQTINDQSAYSYLIDLSDTDGGCHDPDARYQNLFYSPASVSLKNENDAYFIRANIYLGDNTTLIHENRTKTILDNYGVLKKDFTLIDSVAAFERAFLMGPIPPGRVTELTRFISIPLTPRPKSKPTAYNYPYPVQKASDNSVSGYFLNSTARDSVAVLSSPSFSPVDWTEYQAVVSSFLAAATAANKTRLIIDLRHNGGGKVVLAFDLFKQLFPHLEPYGGTRVRGTAAINAMGRFTSAFADAAGNDTALDPALSVPPSTDIAEFWYKSRLDARGRAFASWPSLFGPDTLHGDAFTHITRLNLSDHERLGGFNVSGYGGNNRSDNNNMPPAPFRAADIVLLQDGHCASTCAIFAELVKTQAPGARSVVVGGRPQQGQHAPVGVGCTKGAEVLRFEQVVRKAERVVRLADKNESQQQLLNDSGVMALGVRSTDRLRNRVAVSDPATGQLAATINYRNNYREGDASDTPLQFVADYADCRLWYTAPMLYDPVALWDAVVDAMWTDGNYESCVAGSTGWGNVSSIGGGGGGGGVAGDEVEMSSGGAANVDGMGGFAWAVFAGGVAVVMALLL